MVPSLKTEPSTLKTDIVDGSMPNTGTFHVNASNHGRSDIQTGTFHVRGRNHGWSHPSRPNLPRWRPISWIVQCQTPEPSTLAAENPGRSIDSATQIPHTVATAGRQAGPFPEPGAALSDCSRRRCFRGH